MPVFEGLLPSNHDDIVQTLLFRFAEWQALAKLRLHTEDTVALLDQALRRLGTQIRKFQHITCTVFQAKELPQETARRVRRELTDLQSGRRTKAVKSESLPKAFSINTYKFHALGDYGKTIQLFGTTDSYTTQVVSTTTAVHLYTYAGLGRASAQINQRILQCFEQESIRGTLCKDGKAKDPCPASAKPGRGGARGA